MSLPVVHLAGTPYEQGYQHGEQLRDRIARNLSVYFARFEREVGLPRAEVLSRAGRYREAIAGQNPTYFDNLSGVADGSGFPFDDLVALNVRYEILYYQYGVGQKTDGCTAFAVLPEASEDGHLLLGQNWDWIPEVQGAILHTQEPLGLETLSFTEAGIVGGKIGLNSHGIGLVINGITSTDDDWSRLATPFHVRCYEILRQRDFESAVAVVLDEDRSCSTNYLIAQAPDQVVDIEAAPNIAGRIDPANGFLVHTNHFVDPEGLGVVEPPNERRPYSCRRRERMGTFLAAKRPVTRADLEAYLRDHDEHPFSICRHENPAEPPEQRYITVTSAIMDLHALTLSLTDGPPCANPYQTEALSLPEAARQASGA